MTLQLVHINFPVSPQISHFDSGDDSINAGDPVSLTCNVHKGDIPVDITWFLNDKPIGHINDITIVKGGKRISNLNIDSVKAEHAGVYTCVAQNLAGKTSYSAHLNVNG